MPIRDHVDDVARYIKREVATLPPPQSEYGWTKPNNYIVAMCIFPDHFLVNMSAEELAVGRWYIENFEKKMQRR